jgi:hypothetical protein
MHPEFMQGFSMERASPDNALRFRTVDNFPRLTNSPMVGQIFAERGLKPTAAPDSLHEYRVECERVGEIELGHRLNIGRTVAAQRFASKALDL